MAASAELAVLTRLSVLCVIPAQSSHQVGANQVAEGRWQLLVGSGFFSLLWAKRCVWGCCGWPWD